jgi:hypothetical protein
MYPAATGGEKELLVGSSIDGLCGSGAVFSERMVDPHAERVEAGHRENRLQFLLAMQEYALGRVA